jgi:carotenoid 1,2-hydratase
MPEFPNNKADATGSIISSLKDDAWHGKAAGHSFERWHFDALSDDGREALIIAFYDNYPFSPRYFRRRDGVPSNVNAGQFPAVTFVYAVDGVAEMHAVNEWSFDAFSARMDNVTCSIGDSSFRVEKANYGSGYIVHAEVVTTRNRRIIADLEWVSIESDLIAAIPGAGGGSMIWNLVAPRSDVSGRIVLLGSKERSEKVIHFRGTGYHDHLRNSTTLNQTIRSRCWGRAHFPETTAVFQHIAHNGGNDEARIALIQNGEITSLNADFTMSAGRFESRDTTAEFAAQDCSLKIKPMGEIHRDFFEQRMLSQITMTLADGSPSETMGIVEICDPKGMSNPLYRWMSGLKIGKNGGPPFY